MSEGFPAASLLFLRDEDLRQAFEHLNAAYRELDTDIAHSLAERGLDAAHGRLVCLIGRRPHVTMGELLEPMRVTKQSLGRLMLELTRLGLVQSRTGPTDGRQRQISLSESGRALERLLWERQRPRIARAFRAAGPQAVEGFRKVLAGLADSVERKRLRAMRPVARG